MDRLKVRRSTQIGHTTSTETDSESSKGCSDGRTFASDKAYNAHCNTKTHKALVSLELEKQSEIRKIEKENRKWSLHVLHLLDKVDDLNREIERLQMVSRPTTLLPSSFSWDEDRREPYRERLPRHVDDPEQYMTSPPPSTLPQPSRTLLSVLHNLGVQYPDTNVESEDESFLRDL